MDQESARMRKVLVTGGTGYVGTVLVPLLAMKYPVVCYSANHFGNAIAGTPGVEFIEGDIRDQAGLSKALRGCTYVIHLAGIVTDELAAMNPKLAREINVEALRALLELAADRRIRRFLYASSSGIYGSQRGTAAVEETEPRPETVYMESKLDGEKTLWEYSKLMVCAAVRSATCCGPAPRMRLDTIVNVFCKQAYFDGEITVHDGTQWRTNIHVRDAAEFYALLLAAPAREVDGQTFNICAGNDNALALAYQVAGVIPAKVTVDRGKLDPRQYRMSAEKAWRVLGWQPRRTIEDAIQDNLAFFKAGGVKDPDSDLYYNTRRMKMLMGEKA